MVGWMGVLSLYAIWKIRARDCYVIIKIIIIKIIYSIQYVYKIMKFFFCVAFYQIRDNGRNLRSFLSSYYKWYVRIIWDQRFAITFFPPIFFLSSSLKINMSCVRHQIVMDRSSFTQHVILKESLNTLLSPILCSEQPRWLFYCSLCNIMCIYMIIFNYYWVRHTHSIV